MAGPFVDRQLGDEIQDLLGIGGLGGADLDLHCTTPLAVEAAILVALTEGMKWIRVLPSAIPRPSSSRPAWGPAVAPAAKLGG
ncbi:hypothetical protein D3C81_1788060 [compost metagenome]